MTRNQAIQAVKAVLNEHHIHDPKLELVNDLLASLDGALVLDQTIMEISAKMIGVGKLTGG